MKDPTPWLDGTDATPLERQLLDAARRDLAPAAMKSRMAAALSSLPPTVGTGSAAPAELSRDGLLFSHIGLWGSLTAVILASAVGWQILSHRHTTPAPVAARAATPIAPLSAAAPIQLPAPAPSPAAEPARAPAAPQLTAAAPAIEPSLRLREELALLDAARTALASRETVRALRLLDQHAEQFSRGHLAPEADALRIDALVQRGATERAERLSRRFLERHPRHPLAAHIASVANAIQTP